MDCKGGLKFCDVIFEGVQSSVTKRDKGGGELFLAKIAWIHLYMTPFRILIKKVSIIIRRKIVLAPQAIPSTATLFFSIAPSVCLSIVCRLSHSYMHLPKLFNRFTDINTIWQVGTLLLDL